MNEVKSVGASKKYKGVFLSLYIILFLIGIKALFHGFPDIERFFAEWMDERLALTSIMKFGTLNFAPTISPNMSHPPLYYYLTFIPIAAFFVLGKLIGLFYDKMEFVRFYFNNTHYFFLIGRTMSYIFFWLTAIMIFKITRLFYSRTVAHITTLSYLLIPRFIIDFSTTRPETLLFLNTSIFFYFFLLFYLKNKKKYLFLAAFVLGVSVATKYNAAYLGSIFIPLLLSELKNKNLLYKSNGEFIARYLSIGFFVFLGFFICNPYFITRFTTYFHNLMLFATIHAKYYWRTPVPAIFGLTHIRELTSFMYLNFFGFLILIFGSWILLRREKALFIPVFFVILISEIHLGIFQRNFSPLYYLNSTLPLVALIFGTGVNFVITQRKKLMLVLIIFGLILSYNYFDIWRQLSFGPTYLQKARYFIEQSIPEFTTICITSKSRLPQLNMTEESYRHLINTAPVRENIPGRKLDYKEVDNEENYASIFRELRIKSLTKKPQYNLLRWDKNIKTKKEAMNFLRQNNVKYIIGAEMPMIANRRLIDMGTISLVRKFKSKKTRVYGKGTFYLYKVN